MESEFEGPFEEEAVTPDERFGPFLLDTVTEALIFAADEPVTAAMISMVFAHVSGEDAPGPEEVREAVDRINGVYDSTDRAFRIHTWAGGFRMASIPEMSHYVQALQDQDRKKRLTRSLMETVAILAYRQPVTKTDIESVRGVNCDYALRRLLEHGLIDVVGRAESIGRPLLYGTTDRFLDLFGLNDVSDLPNLREVEEILDDPAFQKERARLLITSSLIPGAVSESERQTEESNEENGPIE